jgi:hypothetical protein
MVWIERGSLMGADSRAGAGKNIAGIEKEIRGKFEFAYLDARLCFCVM